MHEKDRFKLLNILHDGGLPKACQSLLNKATLSDFPESQHEMTLNFMDENNYTFKGRENSHEILQEIGYKSMDGTTEIFSPDNLLALNKMITSHYTNLKSTTEKLVFLSRLDESTHASIKSALKNILLSLKIDDFDKEEKATVNQLLNSNDLILSRFRAFNQQRSSFRYACANAAVCGAYEANNIIIDTEKARQIADSSISLATNYVKCLEENFQVIKLKKESKLLTFERINSLKEQGYLKHGIICEYYDSKMKIGHLEFIYIHQDKYYHSASTYLKAGAKIKKYMWFEGQSSYWGDTDQVLGDIYILRPKV